MTNKTQLLITKFLMGLVVVAGLLIGAKVVHDAYVLNTVDVANLAVIAALVVNLFGLNEMLKK